MNLTVGQTVYLRLEYYHGDTLTETTVKSIGHKWVNLTNGQRIFKGSADLDGNTGIAGKAYLSREAFFEERDIKTAWMAFFDDIRLKTPPGLTLEKIRQVREILNIPSAAGSTDGQAKA